MSSLTYSPGDTIAVSVANPFATVHTIDIDIEIYNLFLDF
jgi:hypothetical protein